MSMAMSYPIQYYGDADVKTSRWRQLDGRRVYFKSHAREFPERAAPILEIDRAGRAPTLSGRHSSTSMRQF